MHKCKCKCLRKCNFLIVFLFLFILVFDVIDMLLSLYVLCSKTAIINKSCLSLQIFWEVPSVHSRDSG